MLEGIGRFHLVLLHLPIGLLCAVLLVHARAWWLGSTGPKPGIVFLLRWHGALALLTAVLGQALATGGGYRGEDLDDHLLSGWIYAASSVAMAIAPARLPGWLYGLGLAWISLLMIATGHLGGKLTHGPDFLTESFTKNQPNTASVSEPPTADDETAAPGDSPHMATDSGGNSGDMTLESDSDMADGMAGDMAMTTTLLAQPVPDWKQVADIIAARCVECHGPGKVKGALRLDSHAHIMAGGSEGPAIIPGNDQAGTFLERVLLHPDERGYMPKKGDGFTAEELEQIKAWIRAGAVDSAEPAPSKTQVIVAPTTDLDQAARDRPMAPAKGQEAIRAAGGTVQPLSDNGALIEVDLSHAPEGTDIAALLKALAPHIAWLDLGGQSIDRAGFAAIAEMGELRRLSLDRTRFDPRDLALVGRCQNLRHLNLVGTATTDAALDSLGGLTGLERLYLWQSSVSAAGVDRFLASVPDCAVDTGW